MSAHRTAKNVRTAATVHSSRGTHSPAGTPEGRQVVSPDAGMVWRRWRWLLAVVAIIVVSALITMIGRAPVSTTPLAPDNPTFSGSMAAAEILRDQGVQVSYVKTSTDAIAVAEPGMTLLLIRTDLIRDERLTALAETGADLVLVEPSPSALRILAPGVSSSTWVSETTLEPNCSDPDANAAGPIVTGGSTYTGGPNVTVCYSDESGHREETRYIDDADHSNETDNPTETDHSNETGSPAETGGLWAITTVNGQRIDIIGSGSPMTNDDLAEAGNAALVLRTLGRNPQLIWLVPTWDGETAELRPDPAVMLPPWLYGMGLAALGVAAFAALWRGRRFGRLVVEPLPVRVKAVETTLGRARLYRRASAYPHAAAALRAGVATRCAQRLGLPASAGRTEIVAAIARTSTQSPATIDYLLYGPSPTTDAALLDLTARLDALEKEIRA